MSIFDNGLVSDKEVRAVVALIGDRIKRRRELLGWSQEGLADDAAIPRNKYGAIERADRYYRVDALIRVLASLKIDMLLLFKQPPPPSKVSQENHVRRLAIEQLERVLDEGTDEDRQIALGSISRWYKALPKKRPE